MSEARQSFERVRSGYRRLDGADKIIFWVHFVAAPALMIGATTAIFGPAVLMLWAGLILWKASDI